MPTYEYVCQACDHEFEIFQQMSEPLKRKCPECGRLKLQRLIGTGAGVIFKGGGFYETDYRSEAYKKAAEAEKKAAEPSTNGTSSKKDKESSPSTNGTSDASTKSSSGAGAASGTTTGNGTNKAAATQTG